MPTLLPSTPAEHPDGGHVNTSTSQKFGQLLPRGQHQLLIEAFFRFIINFVESRITRKHATSSFVRRFQTADLIALSP